MLSTLMYESMTCARTVIRLCGKSYSHQINTRRALALSSVYYEKHPKINEDTKIDVLQGGRIHKVHGFEKRILVWGGKYKSVNDVPSTVSQEVMEKARNKARIKISNVMMLATVLACIGYAYSGREAAKRGESVTKMNFAWHEEMNRSKSD